MSHLKTLHQLMLEATTIESIGSMGYKHVCEEAMNEYVEQYRIGFVFYDVLKNPCNGNWEWYHPRPIDPEWLDALTQRLVHHVIIESMGAIPALVDRSWLGESITPATAYQRLTVPELCKFEMPLEPNQIFRICGGNHRRMASELARRSMSEDDKNERSRKALQPDVGIFLLNLFDNGMTLLIHISTTVKVTFSAAGSSKRRRKSTNLGLSLCQLCRRVLERAIVFIRSALHQ
jgi:hypothetical protein